MPVHRLDRGTLKEFKKDRDGFLRAKGWATRAGVFRYRNPDGSVQREFRPENEVFKVDSLSTLTLIPITNNHPKGGWVDATNSKDLSIGFTGEKTEKAGDYVKVSLNLTNKDAIEEVETGKAQLSCGYSCDLEHTPGEFNGERYDAIQKNIHYNHLAIVDQGRAGPEARIRMDANGETPMARIKLDGIEYDASETIAKHVQDKMSELDKLKQDQAELKKEHEKLQGRADSLTQDLKRKDEEIEKVKKDAPTQQEIMVMAKARLDLEGQAEKLLDSETKLDGLSDLEIKKAIIQKINPELKLDDKSDEYIDGCFSTLNHSQKNDQAEGLKTHLGESGGAALNYSQAREKAMKQDSEAWQSKDS